MRTKVFCNLQIAIILVGIIFDTQKHTYGKSTTQNVFNTIAKDSLFIN